MSTKKKKQKCVGHDAGPSTLAIARSYTQRGWRVVPVGRGLKGSREKGWQHLRLTEEDLPAHFPDLSGARNIAVLLGSPSGGLVDVDLDCPEAIEFAPIFLPATCAFGRASARGSHRLYVVGTPPEKKKVWRDPTLDKNAKGAGLIELRSNGCQTNFPGSAHPSGEAIEWDEPYEPDEKPEIVKIDELRRKLDTLAAATLLARYWPAKGPRHELALALAGGLLRAGWSPDDTKVFIRAVAKAAGDEESDARARDVDSTAERIGAGEQCTGWPTAAELVGEDVISAIRSWLSAEHDGATDSDRSDGESASERKKVAARLMELALSLGAELFHGRDAVPYARVPMHDQHEVMSLRSDAFRLWLTNELYDADGTTASRQAYAEAIDALKARALFRGPEHAVHLRVARTTDAVCIDIGDEARTVVSVTATGWKIEARDDVRFRRAPGMTALPIPERGGYIDDVRDFLNLADESSFVLIVAWLVMALSGKGPFPVLILVGEQGSAKSTTARVLRELIDPNTSPLRSRPRDERDLAIQANNGWVLCFDNLSGISAELSDSVCRISTCGGFATRQLYTDSDEQLFDFVRPVLLNGIDNVANRGDLAERAIVVTLPRITEDKRRDERRFWTEFNAAKPQILGALLDAVAGALSRVDHVALAATPRMADFARWATAAERALGWVDGTVVRAHTMNQVEATHGVLADDVVSALEEVLSAADDEWTGTASELLVQLAQHAGIATRARDWPKDAWSLSRRLQCLVPALRTRDIEVRRAPSRSGGRRELIITRKTVPGVPQREAGSNGTGAPPKNASKWPEWEPDPRKLKLRAVR